MEDHSKYVIPDTYTIKEALVALNKLSDDVLTLLVVDSANKIVGTMTDGDIRRKLIEGFTLEDNILKVVNRNFSYILPNQIDVHAIRSYKQKNISLLPCLNESGEILGIYNLKKRKSVLPIDAVLMAGGKGERLRPLTEKVPKPLLPIGDKVIIDYNVDSLISYGVENIYVTTNYLREQLEHHFFQKRDNVQICCVREPKYLGTIGSVKFVDTFYNDYILVMNSDLFTNVNYEDLFLHFLNNEADMSVGAIPYTISIPYGIFNLEGRVIKNIQEKPVFNYYANAGIYLFKKELLKHIPVNVFFDATDFIEVLIDKGYNVIRFPITGYWIDIGKHEEYKKAQDLVKHLSR